MAILPMQQAEIDKVSKELQMLTGLKFDNYLNKFIEKRIYYRIQSLNLNSHQEYLRYLKSDPKEIERFLEKFTINHTFFFRDSEVFRGLKTFFKSYKKKSKIQVWSAACATGDEAYTVAIILDELKRNVKNFPDFEVTASDIDSRAISIAKKGKYSEFSLHNTPDKYIKTYFKKNETAIGFEYELDDNLKNKVHFIEEDITLGHKENKKYDLILCRNLMIYLNIKARNKLLKVIESRLVDGGLFILGLSESLLKIDSNLKPIDIKNRFYVKRNFYSIKAHQKELEELVDRSKVRKLDKVNQIQHLDEKEIENKIDESSLNKEVDKLNKQIEELPIEEQKKALEKKSFQLIKKELILQEREKIFSKNSFYLKDLEKEIFQKSENIENLLHFIREKEKELDLFVKDLEVFSNQLGEREEQLDRKERQLNHQLNQIGHYTNLLLEKEKLIQVEDDKKKVNLLTEIIDENRIDRVINCNKDRELVIPMGFYGVINLYNNKEDAKKFAIDSLGAGIAIILKDDSNKIYTISHPGFPNSAASKQGYHLISPHSFIDTSIKSLVNTMLYQGAEMEKIKALIVGGARLFNDYDLTFQENIKMVKNELNNNGIAIEFEDLGGLSERSIKYDLLHDSLYVKKAWEFEFKKLN